MCREVVSAFGIGFVSWKTNVVVSAETVSYVKKQIISCSDFGLKII